MMTTASRFRWTSGRVREALEVSGSAAAELEYSGISTDTRTIRAGELFVALVGERFDGAEFIGGAAAAGARGAIAERRPPIDLPDGFELYVVDNTRRALGRLASLRRRAIGPTVVAITGTTGKTTTREMIAAAMGPDAYASPGNLNNMVGLPLSMLAAPESSKVWVLEIASNRRGEVGTLARTAAPDLGVITSIGAGHLEGFGDMEGVLAEKLDLLDAIRGDGCAVVADEPEELVRRARERFPRVVSAGLGPQADERPERWSVTEAGVSWRWREVDFELDAVGVHLLRNAMVALTVARELGVTPARAAGGLRRVDLPPMRSEIRNVDGLTLLVDCYNANPASFRAAIESLESLASGRRRVAIVGTMLELGSQAAELHRRVAGWLLESGVDLVVALGAFGAAFRDLTDDAADRVIIADDPEAAYARTAPRLEGDEVVLLKASRGLRFERFIPMFERDFTRS